MDTITTEMIEQYAETAMIDDMIVEAFIDAFGYMPEDSNVEDALIGEMSLTEYAQQIADEMLDMLGADEDAWVRRVIDIDQMVRDLDASGEVAVGNVGLHRYLFRTTF